MDMPTSQWYFDDELHLQFDSSIDAMLLRKDKDLRAYSYLVAESW